ncbi:MAG TPA: cysteine--tRNA ligase, partial [Rhabdochlamydiaceae bacterium]
DPAPILAFLERLDRVLGVLPLHPTQEHIPGELHDALRKREEARQAKNWKEADTWRDFIHSHGYLIEDTPTGMRLKKRQ